MLILFFTSSSYNKEWKACYVFFNTGIFLCTAIFLYMFADSNLHGFQLLTMCFIILSFFPFFLLVKS